VPPPLSPPSTKPRPQPPKTPNRPQTNPQRSTASAPPLTGSCPRWWTAPWQSCPPQSPSRRACRWGPFSFSFGPELGSSWGPGAVIGRSTAGMDASGLSSVFCLPTPPFSPAQLPPTPPQHPPTPPPTPQKVKPMLAKATNGVAEVLEKFSGREFTCEYKYDGERCQVGGLLGFQVVFRFGGFGGVGEVRGGSSRESTSVSWGRERCQVGGSGFWGLWRGRRCDYGGERCQVGGNWRFLCWGVVSGGGGVNTRETGRSGHS
jgi:hypothetical protein